MKRYQTLVLLGLLVGCSGGEPPPTDPATTDPGETQAAATDDAENPALVRAQQAGIVAKKIAANPEDIDAALDEFNMDYGEYLDLLYEIAADPALSEAYEAARK